eukprot:m.85565 g.85565  ORF g.85565 m.85565 type:complete len:381 (-) comp8392_c0_seq2:3546-4688(-)
MTTKQPEKNQKHSCLGNLHLKVAVTSVINVEFRVRVVVLQTFDLRLVVIKHVSGAASSATTSLGRFLGDHSLHEVHVRLILVGALCGLLLRGGLLGRCLFGGWCLLRSGGLLGGRCLLCGGGLFGGRLLLDRRRRRRLKLVLRLIALDDRLLLAGGGLCLLHRLGRGLKCLLLLLLRVSIRSGKLGLGLVRVNDLLRALGSRGLFRCSLSLDLLRADVPVGFTVAVILDRGVCGRSSCGCLLCRGFFHLGLGACAARGLLLCLGDAIGERKHLLDIRVRVEVERRRLEGGLLAATGRTRLFVGRRGFVCVALGGAALAHLRALGNGHKRICGGHGRGSGRCRVLASLLGRRRLLLLGLPVVLRHPVVVVRVVSRILLLRR